MLIEITRPDFIFENDCGSLVQLVHDEWKQVNVIFSNSGCERGNHYHKENREGFYVIRGRFRLRVSKGKTVEEYEFSTGDMFVIPPMVNHTFIYLEETLLNSLYSIGVEKPDGSKDIWTIDLGNEVG